MALSNDAGRADGRRLPARDRIIVALDVQSVTEAQKLLDQLAGRVGYYKVGMELYNALGPSVVEMVAGRGGKVFLDLKFHDIPNTVARAAEVVTGLGVSIFNIHASGGKEMMSAAAQAAAKRAVELGVSRPMLIAVTVLTSMDERTLREEVGVGRPIEDTVVAWSRLAREAGLDGVVASPREIRAIKLACGPEFLTVTPGVRPAWAAANDQKRVMTPGEAVAMGGDYLVIGRPITAAPDPVEAVERIVAEMEEANQDESSL